MVAAEGGWTNFNLTQLENQGKKNVEKEEEEEKKEEEEKEEGGMLEPSSNSLTQTDRDYFNMVRTEDGKSGFFLNKKLSKPFSKPQNSQSSTTSAASSSSTSSHLLPAFLYHQTLEGGGGRPIVGIYLSKPP